VLVDVIMLAVSLGLILLASVLFTNAIEILGHRLKFHQAAVGGILAAVGTALPETVIPIIAILVYRGDPDAQQVGIGAIAGAPFMLATLAMFVTGVAVVVYTLLGKRKLAMKAAPRQLGLDLTFFVAIYGTAVLVTFIHDAIVVKTVIAVGLLLAYVFYVRKTLATESDAMEECELLLVGRLLRVRTSLPLVLGQVVASVVLMIASAHLFVGYVETVATGLGVPALILSIIITPVATELPEKFNSVIWVGKKKDILAMGNITGAMVFQSSFPVVFGILFTEWDLRGPTIVSAVLALASSVLLLVWVKIRKSLNPFILMVGGLLYAVFIGYLVWAMR